MVLQEVKEGKSGEKDGIKEEEGEGESGREEEGRRGREEEERERGKGEGRKGVRLDKEKRGGKERDVDRR